MRLFVALDIDPAVREGIARFMANVQKLAPDVRWVKPEAFHITLKFLGEESPERMEEIKRALSSIRSLQTVISFGGTGFFPSPRAARVFWIGITADPNLPMLATKVDKALRVLRIPAEAQPFTPHLTLARGGDRRHPRGGSGRPQWRPGDKPQSTFSRLQESLAPLPPPDFGTITATEFFLYESKLSSSGAQYTKLARFPLSAA
jgi:2'-5' RNA ligase